MKDTGIIDKETREPYQIVDAETPRYGHQYDVIDIGMVLPENRIFAAACDIDHARQIASSANYWYGCKLDNGAGRHAELTKGTDDNGN